MGATDNAGENHQTRWTREEIEFLQSQWDGTKATAEVIADLLGRTVNAVSQRHYELEWGTRSVEDAPAFKPEPGAPVSRTVRVRVTEFEVDLDQVCPRCWTLRSRTGECLCS